MDFLWLAKLSITSFQKHFQDANFFVFYNGSEFDDFQKLFNEINPHFLCEIHYVDQKKLDLNPYDFFPRGVWWKWCPFRYDVNFHEISVDTDIICVDTPTTWYNWLKSDDPILIAPERFEKIKINTCGDLHSHVLLRNKIPLNCGVVGQQKGYDFSDEFYDIARSVKLGSSHNSLFITEQGTINLWVYSLEVSGFNHSVLNFERNTWIRDFVHYIERGIRVETIHAVSWHKKIAKELKEILERKVFEDNYDSFLIDVLGRAKEFNFISKKVISHQLHDNVENVDYHILSP